MILTRVPAKKMPTTFTVHGIISGRVQGIGYRWFVEKTAVSLGLGGWVKNLPDGGVEVEAEGDKRILTEFLDLLRTGHQGAYVKELKEDWVASNGNSFKRFEILY